VIDLAHDKDKADPCTPGNETSVSIKCRKFLEQRRTISFSRTLLQRKVSVITEE